MGVTVVAHRFQAPGSTGSVNITTAKLGGLTPKAALFYVTTALTDDSAAAHALMGIGFTDGVTSNFWGVAEGDNLATADTWRNSTATYVIEAINAAGSTLTRAAVTEFIANGITLNFDVAAAQVLVTVVFFAGDDLTAKVGEVALGAASGSLAQTGVGFQPDMMFTANVGQGTHTRAGFAQYSHGVAFDNGVSIEQAVVSARLDDNAAAGAGSIYAKSAAVASQITLTAESWNAAVTSMDADGFTLSRSASPGNDIMGFLALRFGGLVDAFVGVVNSPTAVGDWAVTGPGFTPQCAGIFGTLAEADGTIYNTTQAVSIANAAFDADDGYSLAIACEDDADPTNCESLASQSHIKLNDNAGGALFDANEPGSPFSGSGLAINFDAVDTGTARKWVVWAVQAAQTSGGGGGAGGGPGLGLGLGL